VVRKEKIGRKLGRVGIVVGYGSKVKMYIILIYVEFAKLNSISLFKSAVTGC
jgi:hypothetical protein